MLVFVLTKCHRRWYRAQPPRNLFRSSPLCCYLTSTRRTERPSVTYVTRTLWRKVMYSLPRVLRSRRLPSAATNPCRGCSVYGGPEGSNVRPCPSIREKEKLNVLICGSAKITCIMWPLLHTPRESKWLRFLVTLAAKESFNPALFSLPNIAGPFLRDGHQSKVMLGQTLNCFV
jgi:hypothetical protein